jgi:hypothetical protein
MFRTFAGAFGIVAATAAPAAAQCSMCRTVAQGLQSASALDSAILVLLFPAVGLFTGILLLSFRFTRGSDRSRQKEAEKGPEWGVGGSEE